jgi:minor extracellular serine protease Vpr
MRRAADVLALVGVAALAALALAGDGSGGSPSTPSTGAAGWQGLLGARPAPQLGNRQIIVLRLPSLADRVEFAGGVATEVDERAWTREAQAAQRAVLKRLALEGAPITPEESYVRVLNGFSASLDSRAMGVLERDKDVAGVFAVHAVYPATVSRVNSAALAAQAGTETGAALPGFDGRGVVVALLDTGVDVSHPFVQGRLLPGIDILDPTAGAIAAANPLAPEQLEAHATELAGLVAGAGGPNGLRGVAPAASILPIRVAGWQPDATGGVAVYGRSDQLLAGIEASVDPDGNGDAHDAARIALVGVVEPDAAFADGPLALGAAGASILDTLVVAPAGNDGSAGPAFGTISGPGGAPAALTVGSIDRRLRSPAAHVFLASGLDVLLSGEQELGGTIPPSGTQTTGVVSIEASRTAFFDRSGFSTVAGKAVLLPPGVTSPIDVQRVIAAGAAAVLVDGPVPPGALGSDQAIAVPVVGVPSEVAAQARQLLTSGRPMVLSVGAASFRSNAAYGSAALFTSSGLAFDGRPKPELLASGVDLETSDPGSREDGSPRFATVSGSSVSAAIAAGAAALLAQARPDLDAAALKAALVQGGDRALGVDRGAPGVVDVATAASTELVADPSTLALGSAFGKGAQVGAALTLRNVSRRRLDITLDPAGAGSGADVTLTETHVVIAPGTEAVVGVLATVPALPAVPGQLTGAIRVVPQFAKAFRVPWAIAVPVRNRPLLAGVRLSQTTFVPSDVNPSVLDVSAGRVDGTIGQPQLLPLTTLEIDLVRGDGHPLGALVTLRDVLPGRYRFGITGRDAKGRLLRRGSYRVRVLATPVGDGRPDSVDAPFRIR